MTLLTPGEYDDLPRDVKDKLAGVVQQPYRDQKSSAYRRWRGRLMNGDLTADPKANMKVGYGTGDPKAPA